MGYTLEGMHQNIEVAALDTNPMHVSDANHAAYPMNPCGSFGSCHFEGYKNGLQQPVYLTVEDFRLDQLVCNWRHEDLQPGETSVFGCNCVEGVVVAGPYRQFRYNALTVFPDHRWPIPKAYGANDPRSCLLLVHQQVASAPLLILNRCLSRAVSLVVTSPHSNFVGFIVRGGELLRLPAIQFNDLAATNITPAWSPIPLSE